MKKNILFLALILMLSACTSLTYSERNTIRSLKSKGITIDKPRGNWEKPASPAGAAALNLLPGFGNFYLASGNGGDSNHYLYGSLNLLTWPISILWGIPEAAVDAKTINQRELVYFYTFDEAGVEELKQMGFEISSTGKLIPLEDNTSSPNNSKK